MKDSLNELYPVTIFIDRYGDGWFSFKREPYAIQDCISEGYFEQQEYLNSNRELIYGYGKNPNESYEDLCNKLNSFELLNPDIIANT